jgi:predicted kinase
MTVKVQKESKMLAILTVGISASGKSTFAKKWLEYPHRRMEINRDAVRQELVEHDGKEWSWAKWDWKREGEVTKIIDGLISYAALHKYDVIISDTNLDANRRGKLMGQLEELGYAVELKEFPVTWEEAVKRDTARANGVGISVLAKQWKQWLDFKGRKTYSIAHFTNTDNPVDFPKTKTKAILVDLDGTLATMSNRKPFEWDKVGNDTVNEPVKKVVNAWQMLNSGDVIILSGRDGVCKQETLNWLQSNGIVFHKLMMRKEGDQRDDRIIKEEIFWEQIADKYSVQFVIDDRPKVCRNWRDMGLFVFQVGNPDIEF